MEFLVAGVLAAAVSAAAASAYFQARQLVSAAETRLQGQYGLLRLSEILQQDLSQAGRFGCASAAGAAAGRQSGALRMLAAQDLAIAGFSAQSAALVLAYGRPIGVPQSVRAADGSLRLSLASAPPSDSRFLAADCSGTAVWQPDGGNTAAADGLSGDGGLMVLHDTEAAYAVGSMNGGATALYRFERLSDGWEAQKMSEQINSISVLFAYAECSNGQNRFTFSTQPRQDILPVWGRVKLGGEGPADGFVTAAAMSGERLCG